MVSNYLFVHAQLHNRLASYICNKFSDTDTSYCAPICRYPISQSHYRCILSDDPDCSPPEKLTRQMRHLSKVLKHFWTQWKREYLLELREFHRVCEESGSKYKVQEGNVIIVYDAGQPRGLWRLSKVGNIVRGADGVIHGVCIKVMSKRGALKILHRLLHQIYPLEVCSKLKDKNSATTNTNQDEVHVEKSQPPMSSGQVNSPTTIWPVRRAFSEARDQILGYLMEDSN